MTVQTLQVALEKEHRQIDEGIEEFVAQLANDQRDVASLNRALESLRRHIYLEEKFLFPPFRATGLMMPILVMVREHGEIWQSMSHLDELLAKGAEASILSDACAALLSQLESHNSKEEPIIYTQADQTLSAEASAELSQLLESGVLPDGWVCQAAKA